MSSDTLIIPRGRNSQLGAISIDISLINRVESRMPEMARCNPLTAAELITTFNIGILQVARAISLVDLEVKDAKMTLDEAKADCRLNRSEGILRSLGHMKSSVDLREDVVNKDPDVISAQSRLNTLIVCSEYLHSRMKAIEYAYHGAKKIVEIQLKLPESKNYGGGA